MKIPYGRSDFRRHPPPRLLLTPDKTPFLPLLESDEAGYAHVLFCALGASASRPFAEHAGALLRRWQGGAVGRALRGVVEFQHPTPERSRYLVLSLDFSMVAADSGPEALRQGSWRCGAACEIS